MLSKTISYTDYNGVEREETFLFNLSKPELTEMQFSTGGGYENYLKKIIETKDNKQLIKVFKDLIFKAYGEKSDDGKRFIKSDELSAAFSQTEAYNILFMELATDANKAADFCKGILPADLQVQEKIEHAIPLDHKKADN